jgi:uncharacterized membrane protein YkvA (DUF1232 family)
MDGVYPRRREIREYLELRRFLLEQKKRAKEYRTSVMDFWKSSPSIVSFMDAQYSLIRELRDSEAEVPGALLLAKNEIGESYDANLKFRMLFAKVFDNQLNDAAEYSGSTRAPWKYLWTRPTFTYYRDQFFGDGAPHKLLVFSHWRFVPKSISYLVSAEIERRLDMSARGGVKAPLSFGSERSFHIFDVCFPSVFLARAVRPLDLAAQLGTDAVRKRMRRLVVRRLRHVLREAGVKVGKGQRRPLWAVVARLEAMHGNGQLVTDTLVQLRREMPKEGAERLQDHLEEYGKWVVEGLPETRDASQLTISERELEKLASIALYSPAICLLRSAWSVFGEEDQSLRGNLGQLFRLCLVELRNYFNRELVQAVIERSSGAKAHSGRRNYTLKVLDYCGQAHFQAVVDEYAYLLKNVLQKKAPDEFLKHLGSVFGMYSGRPHLNRRGARGRLEAESMPESAHFALAFGDDVFQSGDIEGAEAEEGRTRKSVVREAFNSPFWPFVLATTSVGQEGLDFHLYCRDIVHWNLPSNPVDLEQREGRLNRYDALCLRQNVARDYSLADLEQFQARAPGNPWSWVFETIDTHPRGVQKYKRGLFPHWVYEPQDGRPAKGIRRHLLFYGNSADVQRYRRLKDALLLYRLVLGQPRQQDLVDEIEKELAKTDNPASRAQIERLLPAYMIDLSPFPEGYAKGQAEQEARRIIGDADARETLAEEVRALVADKAETLGGIREEVEDLIELVHGPEQSEQAREQLLAALAALIYLRNPYDERFDSYGEIGFTDDIEVVRQAHRSIFG